jgi:hypothetical protein
MGRPRKRQFIETLAEDQIPNQSQEPSDPSPLFADDFDVYNDSSMAEPFFATTGQPAGPLPNVIPELGKKTESGCIVWHFGGHEIMAGPPINFGDIEFGSGEDTIPSLDPDSQLSTISIPSITDSGNSPPQNVTGPCSCLASMYLSLAALQQFPSDIVHALKTVRGVSEFLEPLFPNAEQTLTLKI